MRKHIAQIKRLIRLKAIMIDWLFKSIRCIMAMLYDTSAWCAACDLIKSFCVEFFSMTYIYRSFFDYFNKKKYSKLFLIFWIKKIKCIVMIEQAKFLWKFCIIKKVENGYFLFLKFMSITGWGKLSRFYDTFIFF